jgi:peptide/nickel transport system substrate-binding protein
MLREVFNDIRWRQAMSLAINRDEINQLRFGGLATSRQPIFDPLSCTFWIDGIDQNWIEYDPDGANELLDELGLEWDADEEWRMWPDGSKLSLLLQFWAFANHPEIVELLAIYWKAVGVELNYELVDRGFIFERLPTNEHDMAVWNAGGASEIFARFHHPLWLRPPFAWRSVNPLGGTGWYDWLTSDGEQGMEPPEIIKRLWQVCDEWLAEPRGTDRYKELGQEIMQINADNMWAIGTVGLVPRVVTRKKTLRNFPDTSQMVSIDFTEWRPYRMETWWLEE